MTARFTTGIPPKPHERQRTTNEIERAITTERNSHRLCYRRGSKLALCNCGYLLRDVTEHDVQLRHDMHVREVMRVFEAQINGELL